MLLIFESSKDDKASFIVVSLKTLFLFLIKYSKSENSFAVKIIFLLALVAVLFNKSSSKFAIESFVDKEFVVLN